MITQDIQLIHENILLERKTFKLADTNSKAGNFINSVVKSQYTKLEKEDWLSLFAILAEATDAYFTYFDIDGKFKFRSIFKLGKWKTVISIVGRLGKQLYQIFKN